MILGKLKKKKIDAQSSIQVFPETPYIYIFL